MASVYKARHIQLDSYHAIKVLYITAPSLRQRLLMEGKVQANLRHPNIVRVTDVLDVQGAPALVMEFVDGPSLDAWLSLNRPTLDQSLWLFRGILRGVLAAHKRGVVHRDLKPANVMLAPAHDGVIPKVTDFGLVKSIAAHEGHTQAGMALGTPEYMGPEQIRDASDVDQRADMWALGCILYELVCGCRAFSSHDRMSTFNLIVAGQYTAPTEIVADLPGHVDEAIRRLLQVDPDKRLYVESELLALLYPQGTPVAPITAPDKPTRMLLVDSDAEITRPPLLSATLMPPAMLRDGVDLLRIRTAEPAAVRTGSRSARPSLRATAEFPAYRTRPAVPWKWLGVAALPVAAASFVGAALLLTSVLSSGGGQAPRPVIIPPPVDVFAPWTAQARPVDVEDTAAMPTEGTEEEEPPAPPPSPRAPAVSLEPPEPAAPKPATPRPTAPKPAAPKPAPAPRAEASVGISGDAEEVWLQPAAGGDRQAPGSAVPVGRYRIMARFGDQVVSAGDVALEAGERISLECSAFLMQCRQRR
ncbi:MAG: serine/threonine protein kinase [Myxococcales bacterium]|nr:serine/threonine protein kinase [Myxococcales bacterium]